MTRFLISNTKLGAPRPAPIFRSAIGRTAHNFFIANNSVAIDTAPSSASPLTNTLQLRTVIGKLSTAIAAGRARLAAAGEAAAGIRCASILLGAAPVVVVTPTALDQLTGNYVFVVGFCGWFLAQFLKIFTKWYKTGVFTVMSFFDSGGTPSSHSALCSVSSCPAIY